jgi:serine/threonine protein kinase
MEENYDFVEWEEGRIDSIWDWTQVDLTETFGMKGANNAGLTICQRRSRLKGSRLESVFYVCKALNGTRRQGMRSVKREVDMLRKCVHPSILGYKDFSYSGQGLDGMTARLYTEHCAFGDLDQFRFTGKRGHPRLSFQEGAQVFRQLAQALLYIHHGISITEDYLEDYLKLEAELPPESYIVEAAFEPESSSGSRARDNDWHTILHRGIKPGNGQSQTTLVTPGY